MAGRWDLPVETSVKNRGSQKGLRGRYYRISTTQRELVAYTAAKCSEGLSKCLAVDGILAAISESGRCARGSQDMHEGTAYFINNGRCYGGPRKSEVFQSFRELQPPPRVLGYITGLRDAHTRLHSHHEYVCLSSRAADRHTEQGRTAHCGSSWIIFRQGEVLVIVQNKPCLGSQETGVTRRPTPHARSMSAHQLEFGTTARDK